MNKQEYNNSKISRKNPEYKKVRELLKTWKAENNITENCIIHHRDDTDETRAYNEEHYELWGCEEDGTFEYGKYVIFMTIAEHVKYHHTGSKRSEDTCRRISAAKYGHKQSYETRKRMSEARRGEKNPRFGKGYVVAGEKNGMFGKHHSEEARERIREAALKRGRMYRLYKSNGGTLQWQAFLRALKIGLIDKEMYNVE